MEALRDYLENAIDMGYLEDATVILDDVTLDFTGNTKVDASPIVLSSPFGEVTLELHLSNEAGTWKIIGAEASGL